MLFLIRSAVLAALVISVCTTATFAGPTPTLRLPPPIRILPTQLPYREVYQFSFGMPHYQALNGGDPRSGVIADAAGSLYGTTYNGGYPGGPPSYGGYGVVFKLTQAPKGFTERVLFRFDGTTYDDNFLFGPSNLIADRAGNLVGVAIKSFSNAIDANVFELTPSPTGYVFHLIRADLSGDAPLVADSTGALYGIGGYPSGYCPYFCNDVVKLTPSPSGYHASSIFHFSDTNNYYYGLAMDKAGAFYGTALTPLNGPMLIYRLTPTASGYRETIIHEFDIPGAAGDHSWPYTLGDLAVDPAGVVFGTTAYDGRFGFGTVYKLTPTKLGYRFSVIHDFEGGLDGQNPYSPLVLDGRGSVYGTTDSGGTDYSLTSTVFKLTACYGQSAYRETILHRFTIPAHLPPPGGAPGDGQGAIGPLLLGPGGSVFGTTATGGTFYDGTVYELRQ